MGKVPPSSEKSMATALEDGIPTPVKSAKFGERLPPGVRRYAATLALLGVASAMMYALAPTPLRPVAGFVFLLIILGSAWWGGYGPGVLATVATVVVVPSIIDPKFHVTKINFGPVLLVVLLSLLVSRVAATVRKSKDGLQRDNESLDERIRERTQALEASRRSTEEALVLLEATLASIADAVLVTDAAGQVTFCNAVAQELTGWTIQEAKGRKLSDVFHVVSGKTRAPVENPVEKVLREGIVAGLAHDNVLITRDGREIPIDDTGAPIRNREGVTLGVVLVFRDVSQRRRAEETSRRLAAMIEHSDDAIISTTPEGVVTSWNRAAERLFGYSAAEMMGGTIAALVPSDRAGEVKEMLVRAGESPERQVTERLTKDGRRVVVALTVSPIRDEDGAVVGASEIARDITRVRQIEEMLGQAQKMEAVGRLAGGVAHDFNNLLTVILGYTATVSQRLGADPLQRHLTEVSRAAEQAAALTGQLLAFSRKQVTQPRVVELTGFVQESKNMIERLIGEDIQVAVVADGSPCRLLADTAQLTQVLLNLAVNARDAMPTGGKLTIETRLVLRQEQDLGRRGIRPAGSYAVLVVTDNGAGMDVETQEHIFEPFFTTKEIGRGTGLGLATVYGIVQQHGGWIDVYSEPAHGTSFNVYLPAVQANPVEAVSTVAGRCQRRAGTILMVEDQAAIRMLAEDVLAEAGHRILSAPNGRVAMELANQYEQRIDLLVTDVVMPEMSGPELAACLTQSRPGLTVLYVSGYTDHALMHRGTIEQGIAFLQKPFLPEALVERVDELLRAREQAAVVGGG